MSLITSFFKADTRTEAENKHLFEGLMRDSYRQALNLGYRLTGNMTEAEDLVQESYVRAFRFFHRYDRGLSFSSWLYRIITNVHIDQLRRKSRIKTTSLDHSGTEGNTAWDIADEQASPEQSMMQSQLEEPLQLALRAMTPEFRIAVMLADVEGMAYEEIAEIMKISVGTVRSRIHRGRKQLKERLGSIQNSLEVSIR
ncbi:MAG: sigma-70 family RNA polymerase sigma factor [Armatimonadetes bacterium]|nr:sigma-70 family RNA polymerase sigma factor [Armatimonadota bacterium]